MNKLLTTFKKIVSISSPTGQEEQMANFLIDYFTRQSIAVEKDEIGNVFATIPGVGESLFIAAHMDTVEPGRGIMTVVADGIISSKDNTILGADNKATIAVILEVVDRIKNKQHRPLEILFTVDEESTNTGAKAFDYANVTANKGLIADIALPIGTIVLGSPAYARFDITLSGKSAHAAFPEKARNVMHALGAVLSDISVGQRDELTIFNIGIGTFGDARNTIPGTATLQGEIRSFDEKLLKKHMQLCFKTLRAIAKKYNIQVSIDSSIDNPAYVFQKDDGYIQDVAKTFLQCGIEPAYQKSWSVSDANIFNAKRLQVVNIGDGTKNTHTTNESITIGEMEKLATIFQAMCQS